MVASWNVEGDFEEVIDTLEPITFVPCDGSVHAQQLNAWRFEEKRIESTIAPGALVQIVITWQFVPAEDGPPRRPGERLCDSAGETSTVRSVRRLQGSTRWVCESVRHTILAEVAEVFEIERPVVSNGQGGATIERWELDQANVTGCFVESEEDPLDTAAPREVLLVDVRPVQIGARLNRRRGGVYAVLSATPPRGIGEPWLVTVEQIPPAA